MKSLRTAVYQTCASLILLAATNVVASRPVAAQGCALNSPGGKIQHVIYVQFDNVHFTRDNPRVPSDLEQMPHLLNFIKDNGTLLTNHHTPLISHTADDILTSITGVYPDRHGQAVANSFGFFTPPGSKFFDGFASSFAYWTDLVDPVNDPTFNMIDATGKNAPAPWVPYTRAGCNVGAVSTANIELENVDSDLVNVFGPNSPEVQEAKKNFNKAVADFEGIAVHCAAGDIVCSAANGGRPDLLPQEPRGYSGFSALFGHKFVAPVISPGVPLTDLDGNLITDNSTPPNPGFPGFGGINAAQGLAYVAAMQEHGIPITYAYIADVHDNPNGENAHPPQPCVTDPEQGGLGPGDVCHNALAASYDEAFGKFFARMESDGITKSNTLFVITADEGDHFAGGSPSPADCDGVNIPCTYKKIGEIDTNITDLIYKQDPTLTSIPFDIHFDMAPTFYIEGNPAVGSPVARAFERATAQLTAVSVINGKTDHLTRFLADPVELKLLHMVTADPQRTPTFVMFGDPDYFFLTSGKPDFVEDPGFAWNHGGVDPKINTLWLGMVGPGVQNVGTDHNTWSDHTDIRPTMLVLLGLKDDYRHDGRVLVEDLQPTALPSALRTSGANFTVLAQVFKQINASVGELGLESLAASTSALAGGDLDYSLIENRLTKITSQRDALAGQIIQLLEGAEFNGHAVDSTSAAKLVFQAEQLLNEVKTAGDTNP